MTGLTGPVIVGRYLDHGRAEFYPLAEPEVQRVSRGLERVLRTYDLPARSHVLVTSLASQVAAFMPLERALADMHMIVSNADASLFDVPRVVMYVRRFDVRAVLGIAPAVLDGLAAQGHDPAALFAGRVVWATPEACARLAPAEGMTLRMWSELGPAVGAECVHGGGLHVSSEEWSCTVSDQELVLSSRLPKLVGFKAHRTGIRVASMERVCPCGNTDIRVRIA